MIPLRKTLLAGACAAGIIVGCARNDAPARTPTPTPAAADAAASAQQATPPPAADGYEPQVGQAGKDVIWVPTAQTLVDRMLDMAKLTPQDRLVDLGSGDGVTVITAAKRGATAHGIEYNPDMVKLAKSRAAQQGVSERATFEQADIFKTDFTNADVVTLFLLPELNLKLRPTLLDMKPGTRVVSNSFDMARWEPDETAEVTEGCENYCKAMLWIVPAKVEGNWAVGNQVLNLRQTFQKLQGTLGPQRNERRITEAQMHGSEIRFKVGNDEYVGQVEGDRMSGTVNGSTAWSATRAK